MILCPAERATTANRIAFVYDVVPQKLLRNIKDVLMSNSVLFKFDENFSQIFW